MKVHQNIVIDGVDYGELKSRRNSIFYNEGKWETFIAPHLPEDCSEMTFIEIGCNAGIMLKKAKEKGFKKVIGIERDEDAITMGKRYRTMDYEIRHAEVDKYFDVDSLPMSDYILLSNVHYYIHMPVFLDFINLLRRKTRYLILVSDPKRKITFHFPQPEFEIVKRYFRLWESVNIITDIKYDKNQRARPKMFSVLFKTKLERISIEDILNSLDKPGRIHYKKARVLSRKINLSEKDQKSLDVMNDVFENGIKKPIILLPNNRIVDGSHRLAALKKLNNKSVIAEYCE